MCRVFATGVGLSVDGLHPHFFHQACDAFSADVVPLQAKHVPKHSASGKGVVQVKFVQVPHEHEVFLCQFFLTVVCCGSGKRQYFAL